MPVSTASKIQDKTGNSTVRKPVLSMPEFLDMPNCTVDFMDIISLPAKEAGTIKELSVKEGDYIPAGKIVGKIDDEMYRIMLEKARMQFKMANNKASQRIAIEAAEAKYKVAKTEANMTSKLAGSGSKTQSEKRMADYTAEVAALEVKQAWVEQADAVDKALLDGTSVREVEARVQRHVLKTKFEAYVVELIKKEQEFVNAGDPVLRLGRMDTLWVQGVVDIKDVNAYEVQDRPVTVTVTLARNETTTFEGKIVNVGLERQGLSGYLVKAEVKNRAIGKHWVLQPLSSVKMRIHLGGSPPPANNNGFGTTSQGFKR
ncbi:MAG: HlyD family secretion protein [Mariniblastus sp.]